MFKYNEATHSIEELPEMKEPAEDDFYAAGRANEYADVEDYFLDREFREYNEAYQKHIASLKSYPVAGEVNWKDGDILEEGKQFKIIGDVRKLSIGAICDSRFAVPIQEQNKKVEEEKEKEDEADKAANEYGTKIHYPGESREWKQKLIGDKATSFKAGWMACKNNFEC